VQARIVPLARSSSISSSLSFADMDRYRAVTEYLFDWRTERDPSWEDIVFWRETGLKDEEEEVDARDGACSMETAMTFQMLAESRSGGPRRVSTGGSVSCCRGMRFHGMRWGDWRGRQRRLGTQVRVRQDQWQTNAEWPLRFVCAVSRRCKFGV
jgi:hypothetical protein